MSAFFYGIINTILVCAIGEDNMEKLPKFMSSWFWHAPAYFDKWRLFPRAFIVTYLWLVYASSNWFMALSDPSNAQSAFISVVIGTGAAWFGLYVNSGRQRDTLSPYERADIDRLTAEQTMATTTQTAGNFVVTAEYKPRVYGKAATTKPITDPTSTETFG